MSYPESDIGEGIIPDKIPEHTSPSSTDFLPWHRLRKQLIRGHQWNHLVARNVKRRWRSKLTKFSECISSQQSTMHAINGTLNCLVIPGDHLLHIRSMWNEISPLDCVIRYLGFNEGHGSNEVGTTIQISNNAVTSLPGIVHDSQVVHDPFEAIGNSNSQAYQQLKKYGPYHVVNLDLCDSFFPNKLSNVEPSYQALKNLLTYQFAEQTMRWLLFITTVVEPGAIDETGMQKLCKPTRHNLDTSSRFASEMENLVPKTVWNQTSDTTVNLANLTEGQITNLFGVALGKWILRMGQSASPKWNVGMRRSFQYSINEAKGAVMLSLAFEMIPNFSPPIDTTGMTGETAVTKAFPTEEECAVSLTRSVTSIRNADAMSKDPKRKPALLIEAANLMESSGFDRAQYIEWVDGGEPSNQTKAG